jgi:flagellar biosynthetic protein FlhB
MEGDPLVKNRLRQYMRQMLTQSMRENVAKADVVITNPTHFAVAIQYDKIMMPGPMVVAKGEDALAFRIREIATANGVPLMEDRPLARALYAEVEVGDIIPDKYYRALSIILAKVYAMKAHRA